MCVYHIQPLMPAQVVWILTNIHLAPHPLSLDNSFVTQPIPVLLFSIQIYLLLLPDIMRMVTLPASPINLGTFSIIKSLTLPLMLKAKWVRVLELFQLELLSHPMNKRVLR